MTQLLPIAPPAWPLTAVSYTSPAARDLTWCLYREQIDTYGTADDPQATEAAEFDRPHGLFLIMSGPDGRAIACGGWRTAGPAVAEIKRMFVARPARGEGLGGHVLGALERDASAHGMTTAILETGVNNHAAIALYTRFGYNSTLPYAAGRDPLINRAFRKTLTDSRARSSSAFHDRAAASAADIDSRHSAAC